MLENMSTFHFCLFPGQQLPGNISKFMFSNPTPWKFFVAEFTNYSTLR